MKKIKTIELQKLKDRQFVEFALESLNIFQKWAKNFELEALCKSYEINYQKLQESYKRLKTNLYTERIHIFDAKRDQAFRLIWHSSKASIYSTKTEIVAAAKKIIDILSLYGGSKIINYDYNGQTAALENAIQQLKKVALNEITLLGFTETLMQLEKDNESFRKAYEERNQVQTENKLLDEIREIRSYLKKIFAAIVKQIEIFHLSFLDKTKESEEFIAGLNVVIMKYHPLTLPKNKKVEQEKE